LLKAIYNLLINHKNEEPTNLGSVNDSNIEKA